MLETVQPMPRPPTTDLQSEPLHSTHSGPIDDVPCSARLSAISDLETSFIAGAARIVRRSHEHIAYDLVRNEVPLPETLRAEDDAAQPDLGIASPESGTHSVKCALAQPLPTHKSNGDAAPGLCNSPRTSKVPSSQGCGSSKFGNSRIEESSAVDQCDPRKQLLHTIMGQASSITWTDSRRGSVGDKASKGLSSELLSPIVCSLVDARGGCVSSCIQFAIIISRVDAP